MEFVWISPRGLGLDFAYRLEQEGHKVLVYTPSEAFDGMLRNRVADSKSLVAELKLLTDPVAIVDDLMDQGGEFAVGACEMVKARGIPVLHDATTKVAALFRNAELAQAAAAALGIPGEKPAVNASIVREGVVYNGTFHSTYSYTTGGSNGFGTHTAMVWTRRRPMLKWDAMREIADGYSGAIAVRVAVSKNGEAAFAGFEPGWQYPSVFAWRSMQEASPLQAWIRSMRQSVDRGVIGLAAYADAEPGVELDIRSERDVWRANVEMPGEKLVADGGASLVVTGRGESASMAVDAIQKASAEVAGHVKVRDYMPLIERFQGLNSTWR
jgi:hypothetical protein